MDSFDNSIQGKAMTEFYSRFYDSKIDLLLVAIMSYAIKIFLTKH
jgi:hypothetical protein